MNTETLEEIISATVDKRIREMVEQCLGHTGFNYVHEALRTHVDAIFREDFEKRHPAIREQIGAQLDSYDITSIEAKVYVTINTEKKGAFAP